MSSHLTISSNESGLNICLDGTTIRNVKRYELREDILTAPTILLEVYITEDLRVEIKP